MTLEWEQQLHNLNAAETAPARADKVQKLKDQLRVGTHLVLSGNRVIVSKRQIAYNSPTPPPTRILRLPPTTTNLLVAAANSPAHPPAVKASPTGRGISKTAHYPSCKTPPSW